MQENGPKLAQLIPSEIASALHGEAVPWRRSWRLMLLTAGFLLYPGWKDKNGCRDSSQCIQGEVQVLFLMGGLSLRRELGKAEAEEGPEGPLPQSMNQKLKYEESSLRMHETSLGG